MGEEKKVNKGVMEEGYVMGVTERFEVRSIS